MPQKKSGYPRALVTERNPKHPESSWERRWSVRRMRCKEHYGTKQTHEGGWLSQFLITVPEHLANNLMRKDTFLSKVFEFINHWVRKGVVKSIMVGAREQRKINASIHLLSSFHLLFFLDSQPVGRCLPHSEGVSSPFSESSLVTFSQKYPEICVTKLQVMLNPIRLAEKFNCHRSGSFGLSCFN